MRFISTAVVEFVIYIFLASVIVSLIKVLFFRKFQNVFLSLLGFASLFLIGGLVIAYGIATGMDKTRIDGFEAIPIGLMVLGIIIGTVRISRRKAKLIGSPATAE